MSNGESHRYVSADTACDLLNEALGLDPAAINTLFGIRRTCSKAFSDHPHIQVRCKLEDTETGPFWIGLLGIVNGMLLAAGSPDVVIAVLDDAENQNILKFAVKPYKECEG